MKVSVSTTVPKKVVDVPPARFLRIKEATENFRVKLMPSGDVYELEGGDELELEPGHKDFTRLIIENLGDDTLTVELFTSKSRVSNAYARNARTVADAGGAEIDYDTPWSVPGIVDGRRRKQIVVFNHSTTEDVKVTLTTAPYGPLGIVPPRTSWTVETDADLMIRTDSVAPIVVTAGLLYYA
jgi:hypothetical protein